MSNNLLKKVNLKQVLSVIPVSFDHNNVVPHRVFETLNMYIFLRNLAAQNRGAKYVVSLCRVFQIH